MFNCSVLFLLGFLFCWFIIEFVGVDLKVVENHLPLQSESMSWDSQPLPAYQYFENVRNFLVAVKQLNLPAFEASDLERVFKILHKSFTFLSKLWQLLTMVYMEPPISGEF